MARRTTLATIAASILLFVIVLSTLSSGFLKTSRTENVKIEVIYSGNWRGIIYNNEETVNMSGINRKAMIITRPFGENWNLTCCSEKMEDTSTQMKVVIRFINGTILKQAQTNEPYGKIVLSVEIP